MGHIQALNIATITNSYEPNNIKILIAFIILFGNFCFWTEVDKVTEQNPHQKMKTDLSKPNTASNKTKVKRTTPTPSVEDYLRRTLHAENRGKK